MMLFTFDIITLWSKLLANWLTTIVTSLICIVFVAIALGDGTPHYPQFPSMGQGFLKPWLTWTTADRWRLHEIEPIAYDQVCFSIFHVLMNTLSKLCATVQ